MELLSFATACNAGRCGSSGLRKRSVLLEVLVLFWPLQDKFLFSEPFKSSQIGVIVSEVHAVLVAVICSAEI